MNGLSIFISLDKENQRDLDNILSTFFQSNTHRAYELFVLDQTDDPDSVQKTIAEFATKGFIRRIRTPNSSLTHKVRYPQFATIKTPDDVHKLAKGELSPLDVSKLPEILSLPKAQDREAGGAQPQISGQESRADDTSVEELRQENELLLLQLHQVQEELEEYYLKYQELKKSTEAVTG